MEIFEKGTFSLGVNYWASHAATRMWTEWDEATVRQDIMHLAEIGCSVLRVFPLWPDFQPVMVLRSNCFKGGYKRGYAFTGERPLPNTEAGRAGVDETMMERFETLCDIAGDHGMKIIVPIINGHMTFRIYNPPAVDGLDHFRDPESLMWQGKFVRYFVKRMKHHPAIVAWEIGNESNCMSVADDRTTAWSWTAFITDAIRSQDHSRPISSGMHSLALHDTAKEAWTFADQAELCDVLTSHPYPMWKPTVTCDKPNTLRWALLTPTENQLYADIGGKESFAEEVGTLRRTFSTFEALGDNLRNVLWLLWSNDSRALLWWCAFDQTGIEFPPYDWDEPGMEHGVFTTDYKLNPTGRAIRDFTRFLQRSSVKKLPQPREKAVCILGRDQNLYDVVSSVGIIAKQAGLPLQYVFCEEELPDAAVYLVPCAIRKGGLSRQAYRTLQEKAAAGATVYFSWDYSVHTPDMEAFFGLEIENREQNSSAVSITVNNSKPITLTPKYRFTIRSHGAEPLDDTGLLWEYPCGKGRIITAALPLETLMLSQPGSYQTYPAYAIYRYVGATMVEKNLLICDDCEVVISEHPLDSKTVYAIVCNCSPGDKQIALTVKSGWSIISCESDTSETAFENGTLTLPANAGALLTILAQ